ncbi:MAG TPA: alpha/beta family hydrolase [Thermoleophilaceae bacterium]|nr:alpha/beta family hydrolase [Thermoleophilaceae bacterium]
MIRAIETPRGTARVLLQHVLDARGAIVLGHGAGGSVSAPDLQVATRAALDAGLSVALVEQPYRVAGRRSAPSAPHLDEAWTAVLADLYELQGLPLVTGGRSSGARVACRTAEATGAAAVLCLAFPLQPPARSSGAVPDSRLPELDVVSVPVLVVQGQRDPFGVPPAGPRRQVVRVNGDHSLKQDPGALSEAVQAWLRSLDL